MKFLLSWMREFVQDGIPPADLARRLTSAGMPVETIAPLPPDEQARVDRAIEKGLEYLKKLQQATGTWSPSDYHPVGLAAGFDKNARAIASAS